MPPIRPFPHWGGFEPSPPFLPSFYAQADDLEQRIMHLCKEYCKLIQFTDSMVDTVNDSYAIIQDMQQRLPGLIDNATNEEIEALIESGRFQQMLLEAIDEIVKEDLQPQIDGLTSTLNAEIAERTQGDSALNARIDNLVLEAGGDSPVEVTDARTDAYGRIYPTLSGHIRADDLTIGNMFTHGEITTFAPYSATAGGTVNRAICAPFKVYPGDVVKFNRGNTNLRYAVVVIYSWSVAARNYKKALSGEGPLPSAGGDVSSGWINADSYVVTAEGYLMVNVSHTNDSLLTLEETDNLIYIERNDDTLRNIAGSLTKLYAEQPVTMIPYANTSDTSLINRIRSNVMAVPAGTLVKFDTQKGGYWYSKYCSQESFFDSSATFETIDASTQYNSGASQDTFAPVDEWDGEEFFVVPNDCFLQVILRNSSGQGYECQTPVPDGVVRVFIPKDKCKADFATKWVSVYTSTDGDINIANGNAGGEFCFEFATSLVIRPEYNFTQPYSITTDEITESLASTYKKVIEDRTYIRIPSHNSFIYDYTDGQLKIVSNRYVSRYRDAIVLMRNAYTNIVGGALKYLYERAKGGTGSSVISLNRDAYSLMRQAKWNYTNSSSNVALLQFTDIHGDTARYGRILEWLAAYSAEIDDCICTGDMLETNWTSSFDWWTNQRVLTCIGNHDCIYSITPTWDDLVPQEDVYNRFIAPFYGSWGDVAVTPGLTYYYKDYASKSVRLIVINMMLKATAEVQSQLAWLESTLADANTDGLHVLIATHAQPYSYDLVECNFTSKRLRTFDANRTAKVYYDAVDAFKRAGGVFVGWLSGHSHIDMVMTPTDYSDQLVIDSCCSILRSAAGDIARLAGTKTEDLFNMVYIDTANSMLEVVRVGADETKYMSSRKAICFDYANGVVVGSL